MSAETIPVRRVLVEFPTGQVERFEATCGCGRVYRASTADAVRAMIFDCVWESINDLAGDAWRPLTADTPRPAHRNIPARPDRVWLPHVAS